MTGVPVLAARGLSKVFGLTYVLDGVDFDLIAGEVHAVVGENGAGKSTLGKILSGVYRPDAGEIMVDGVRRTFSSPAAAQAEGIVMIYQEPALFPDLDVGENILLGQQPRHTIVPLIRRRAMYTQAEQLLNSLGAHLAVRAPIAQLSVAAQQLVEIAAALARNIRVLIMDEPTASLTPQEVEDLFRVIRRLKERGVSILFVSHRLDEVFAIADRITVLRDGRLICTTATQETTKEAIIRNMVGRDLAAIFPRERSMIGDAVLACRGLSRRGAFCNVDLEIRQGEIIGLAGLIGAGRTAVAHAIFGIDPPDTGEILLDGKPVHIRSPRDAVAFGLALVPENRQRQGLILTQPVTHNITLTILRQIAAAGWIRRRREIELARSVAANLRLKARRLDEPVEYLSGGNQQKVVLAKWLVRHPRVLILDEPTRGIDVGAKAEVHRLMRELTTQGMGILMISSELPEILAMSDRIIVMREGQIVARFERSEASAERVVSAAAGQDVAVTVHR
jgi:rhamnose transport system ATP-binding protein